MLTPLMLDDSPGWARPRVARALLAAGLALTAAGQAPALAAASESGAVIFMYHRFGEDDIPTTNIPLGQFTAHLAELTSGKYNVMALPDIIAAFRAQTPLPDRTVAITIDDAYSSVYHEGWPRLREAGLPFTLFVATDPVDNGVPGYMSWDQIRELQRAGVAIANHTTSHLHMPAASPERNAAAVLRANRRLQQELGVAPDLFAYPYGEYSRAIVDEIRRAGFDAAFGQHSGVAHAAHDLFTLPRFALTASYGSLARLKLAASALPLPVEDVTPRDPMLRQNPPPIGFTVAPGIERLGGLACYASNESVAAHIERLGLHRFEVRLSKAFRPGRGRLNCTLAAGNGRWRWFGIQFYIPR